MKSLKVKDIAQIGMMIATIEVAKNALAFLPNVELVTLLFILYTLTFGRKVLFVVPAFILLEGTIYGFGLWWVMYLYTWPLLVFITWLFRRQESVLFWSVLSGVFGLMFGALCSIPYFIGGGVAAGVAWWIAGIPYDILHCIANFLICLILYVPLRGILHKMR
ncbi:MAG: hypothetical protein Q4B72_04835 [Lachnospiraceae bacterium]|nr:hypothetical protein [Lachnospiraceae bacterium]